MKSLQMLGIVGLAASMTGCVPDWARENETGLLMDVIGISTLAGGEGGTEGDILLSDVDPDFNDDAVVTVQLYRKNPTVSTSTPLEDVVLQSYQVRYFRSDGHNVEGFDVPHRITGALNSVILHAPTEIGESTADVIVTLVRQQAKHEAPLATLVRPLGVPATGSLLVPGQGIITTIAEITVYGRQITSGDALSATGRVQVTFADFANE
jgi:hypothetical protein